jgi:guanine deaminase
LLNQRAVLAHGIWLDQADRALLAETGAQVAHCPSSNLFLGSGLLDWAALQDAGVAVTLASDVGGGTSLSPLRTMAEAYKVQALQGLRMTAWKLLYSATLRRGACAAPGARDRHARAWHAGRHRGLGLGRGAGCAAPRQPGA